MALDFFTFTRNSVATQLLEDGSLDTNIAIDVPVINYRDGQFAGYYSQRSATNLFERSEEFDNAYWTKTRTTVTANATTAPNGTTTADKLIEDTSTGQHFLRRDITVSAGTYTVSAFIKEAGRQYVSIFPQQSGVTAYSIFDLINGTITKTGGNSFVSSKIEEFSNGFYRCSVTINASSASLNTVIYLTNAELVEAPSYTGDGTSSIFIWGAQLEEGDTATEYIRTTSASVTRDKDVATLSNATDLISQTAGSIQVTAEFSEDYPLNVNGLQATVSGTKTIRFEYSPTEIKLFVDNTLVDSDTGTYDWSTLDKIELGHFDGEEQPNFELRDLIVRKA